MEDVIREVGGHGEHDRLSTLIAVMIAVVSVVAAIGAWRVAVATSNANGGDVEGLLAAVDREDAVTSAYVTVYARLSDYARAVADDAIAKALEPVQNNTTDTALKARIQQEREARQAAANQLRFSIPQQYIGRNQQYDDQRDAGEAIADRSLEKDTLPEPHFTYADAERRKAEWLLVLLVMLGAAFVLLTLADAIKRRVRYALLAGALALLTVAVVGGLLVEVRGAFF